MNEALRPAAVVDWWVRRFVGWAAEVTARNDPLVRRLMCLGVDFGSARRLVDEDRRWASDVADILTDQQEQAALQGSR